MARTTGRRLDLDSGVFDLEPWQIGYRSPPASTIDDTLAQLAIALSFILPTLGDIHTTRPLFVHDPTSTACAIPAVDAVSLLRQLVPLEHSVDRIQNLHTRALHYLKCQTFALKSTTSPCAALPDHILAKIFEFLRGPLQHRVVYSGRGWNGQPGQITVAAVCHRWRRIAHDTPSLWNEIISYEDLPAAVLRTWIARAGRTPLKLRLDGLPCLTCHWRTQVSLLNEMSANGQLKHLVLAGHASFFQYIAEEWTAAAPGLEELELTFWAGKCRRKPKVTSAFLRRPQTLPVLRRLTILAAGAPLLLLSPGIMLAAQGTSRLEYLKLDYSKLSRDDGDLGRTLDLLRCCPKLVHAELIDIFFCYDHDGECDCKASGLSDRHKPVLLPNLARLDIGGERGCCWRWLGLLEMPRLDKVNGPIPKASWDRWIRWAGRAVPFLPPPPRWMRLPRPPPPPSPPPPPPSPPLPHPLEIMGFVKQQQVHL